MLKQSSLFLIVIGYGLSYTTFAFKNLKVSPPVLGFHLDPGACRPLDDDCYSRAVLSQPIALAVDFDVKNTGHRAGAEVCQLYVGFHSSSAVPEPPEQLKGFERVELPPRETRHIRFVLYLGALSYWNTEHHDWAPLPGTYKVMVGSSSRGIRLRGTFRVSSAVPAGQKASSTSKNDFIPKKQGASH